MLLAATEQMVFGTGIASIWARSPQTMHGAAALLAQAYPDRFVPGLGVGYPEQAASVGREFGRPLATMRDYLDRMGAPAQLPAPDVAYPRIIGANGPKMLALAGEITDGAMPALQPPEFTAQARQALGPDKLLVVFVHANIEQGDASAIAATVREHLAAGADHVMARRADRHRLRCPRGPPRTASPGAGRAALRSKPSPVSLNSAVSGRAASADRPSAFSVAFPSGLTGWAAGDHGMFPQDRHPVHLRQPGTSVSAAVSACRTAASDIPRRYECASGQ